jgi:stage II sporulation protein D
MKALGRDILIAFVAGVVMPAMIVRVGLALRAERREVPTPLTVTEPSEVTGPYPSRQILFRDTDGSVGAVELEEYLVGAVLGEMPASFGQEALKAQAVAARTYAWKAARTGSRHPDGSVCGSYACCQAYISPESYLDRGGLQRDVDKVRSAVLATAGQVLTYGGELIEATYFSCSGGRTEDAVAVWGNDFPYLRSVESPGEEDAAWFTDEAVFSREELETALGVELPDDASHWFGEMTHTAGGGVETVRIGDSLFPGTKVRSLLGLRSTVFSVTAEGDIAVFSTRGYGHRVGMSQYGADAMAADGADHAQILGHYYPGTELMQLEE